MYHPLDKPEVFYTFLNQHWHYSITKDQPHTHLVSIPFIFFGETRRIFVNWSGMSLIQPCTLVAKFYGIPGFMLNFRTWFCKQLISIFSFAFLGCTALLFSHFTLALTVDWYIHIREEPSNLTPDNLRSAASTAAAVCRQQSESGAGNRKRNHLILLPPPEGGPEGEARL